VISSMKSDPISRLQRAGVRLVLLAAAPGVTGCALGYAGSSATSRDHLAVRPATDVPARFEPYDAALRLAPGDTIAGAGCVSPMVDPRDGTRVRFINATWYGDYVVPAGRYGAREGEVLRLECNTGRVLGLVPR
jgi:hypothetical protein